jgi:hypothetical protein
MGWLADVLTILGFCFCLNVYRKAAVAFVRWLRRQGGSGC